MKKKELFKVLVIGSGGREHAIAWSLAKDQRVSTVYVAPGNGGTFHEPKIENVNLTNFDELSNFALENKIRLTVVGPEGPLSEGLVNKFAEKQLPIFGPERQLNSSHQKNLQSFSCNGIKFQARNLNLSVIRHSPTIILKQPLTGR